MMGLGASHWSFTALLARLCIASASLSKDRVLLSLTCAGGLAVLAVGQAIAEGPLRPIPLGMPVRLVLALFLLAMCAESKASRLSTRGRFGVALAMAMALASSR